MSDLEQRLDAHIRFCQERFALGEQHFQNIQQQQTQCILQLQELTASISAQTEATAGIVQAYENVQGTLRVARGFNKALVWASTTVAACAVLWTQGRDWIISVLSGMPPPPQP